MPRKAGFARPRPAVSRRGEPLEGEEGLDRGAGIRPPGQLDETRDGGRVGEEPQAASGPGNDLGIGVVEKRPERSGRSRPRASGERPRQILPLRGVLNGQRAGEERDQGGVRRAVQCSRRGASWTSRCGKRGTQGLGRLRTAEPAERHGGGLRRLPIGVGKGLREAGNEPAVARDSRSEGRGPANRGDGIFEQDRKVDRSLDVAQPAAGERGPAPHPRIPGGGGPSDQEGVEVAPVFHLEKARHEEQPVLRRRLRRSAAAEPAAAGRQERRDRSEDGEPRRSRPRIHPSPQSPSRRRSPRIVGRPAFKILRRVVFTS